MNPVDRRLFVGGVEKGLRVLAVFRDQPLPLSLSEIAESSGLGRSAAQRFVYTLKMLGYLRQDPATRRYALTPKMLDFGYAYLRNDSLVEKAFPYLLEASKRTDETVNLTELDDTEVVYVSRFPSRRGMSVDIVLGARMPAYCTAPGRAILSGLPEEAARDVIERSRREQLTRFTVTEPEQILERIRSIRERGYAVSNQESFVGDISVAAAVRNHRKEVLAAVNVAVPHPRWTAARAEKELAPVVIETARAISKALGGR